MSLEFKGKLIVKNDTIQVSDKFKKREFVLEKTETNNGMEFTDYVKFQLTQDRCSLIDSVNINDDITVKFNLRGNKWEKEGKVNYFTNLDVWKIESDSYNQDVPPAPSIGDDPEEDSLPF